MSLWPYYWSAVPRAFLHGWQWAEAQGIWLTIWLAVSAVVVEILRKPRLWRGRTDGAPAMKGWTRVIKEGTIAIGGGVLVLLFALFIWFFVQDAPQQMQALQGQINDLGKKARRELADSDEAHKRELASIQSQVSAEDGKITLLTREVAALREQIPSKIRVIWEEPRNKQADNTNSRGA